MLMRHHGRSWASLASGLLSCAALGLATSARAQAPEAAPPAVAETQTVPILDAQKSGDLAVTVRGQGDDRVKFSLTNRSAKRLNVVIPPGLVAASGAGQGGFQSMGLGGLSSNPGRFGAYKSAALAGQGFRSVPPVPAEPEGVAVSPGKTVEFTMPSVCLNYGVNTPTPRNVFRLMTVEDYTPDARARRSLISLATLGTSQGVAQAVMWHTCNGMTFDQLASQSVKAINGFELAQAARFVEALDASGNPDGVEPAYFQQGRMLVRVVGEGSLSKEAKRLAGELDGKGLLGLPVRIADESDIEACKPGAILLNVVLSANKSGVTSARVAVRHSTAFGGWTHLGQADVREAVDAPKWDGEKLAEALGRSVARSFVTATTVRHSTGGTTVKITNRLPMTLAHVTLRAGKTDADMVQRDGMGVGPMRNATTTIPAASASIERVVLNGL